MKKLILVISIVASGILNVQATEKNDLSNYETELNPVSQVFVWNVITNNGTFSGTSTTLSHARNMVKLSSAGDTVLEQKIEMHYVLKEDLNNQVYYWEVESALSKATGFSSTEANAKKLIGLVAEGDIITYKIIVNKKFKKKGNKQ